MQQLVIKIGGTAVDNQDITALLLQDIHTLCSEQYNIYTYTWWG